MSNPNPSYKIPKGTTPNPHGRPKRAWTVQGLIEEAMEEQDETGVPAKKIVYKRLVQLAARGDMQAVREINNRLDGMPQQTTDINVTGDVTIDIDGLIGLSKTAAKTTDGSKDTS